MHTRRVATFGLIASILALSACSAGGATTHGGDGGGDSGGGAGAPTTSAGGNGTTGSGGNGTGGSGGGNACAAGTADCNGDPADGCETNIDSEVATCGACDKACPTTDNTTATCVGGKCVPVCDEGYADCNLSAADGCESFLPFDAKNCGACGNVCPDGPGVPGKCFNAKCTVECAPGKADCDFDAADGCEVDTNQDPNHCGGCGKSCGGAPCVAGACACAAESQTAQALQLDLYIMLDQSGSMTDSVQGGGTKWDAVTAALKGFFASPANAGLGVGLQYFPLVSGGQVPVFCATNVDCGAYGPCFFGLCIGGGGGGGDSCAPADYAKPDVAIAKLSAGQVMALNTSINGHSPTGGTPTGPSLQGAIDHAKAFALANPSHKVVVVYATDGEPSECNPADIPGIANIAAAGAAGSPSIKTFVIGVGPSLNNLNAIAQAGGSGQAFLVDTNQNVVQQLTAALAAIQNKALGCEYTIPQPMNGMLDYAKVNVQYTPGGQPPVLLDNVTNQAACDPQKGGWYYDNNAAPTKILLCPSTCNVVQSDPSAKMDVLLGCATQHM